MFLNLTREKKKRGGGDMLKHIIYQLVKTFLKPLTMLK
jgi:hypothetical protein